MHADYVVSFYRRRAYIPATIVFGDRIFGSGFSDSSHGFRRDPTLELWERSWVML